MPLDKSAKAGFSTNSPARQAKLPILGSLPSLWTRDWQHWLCPHQGLLHGLQSALESTVVHPHVQHQILHGASRQSPAPACSLPPGTLAVPGPSLGVLLLVAPCLQAGLLLCQGIVVAAGPQVLLTMVLNAQGPCQGIQPCLLAM